MKRGQGSTSGGTPRTTLFAAVLFVTVLLAVRWSHQGPWSVWATTRARPLRVLVDSDLGTDIDDIWALATVVALARRHPGLIQIEGVLTASYNTTGRARVACQFLERVGFDQVPVLVGPPTAMSEAYLAAGTEAGFGWAEQYDMAQYRGGVEWNGLDAALELLSGSTADDPVLVLELAPAFNLDALTAADATLAQRLPVAAMSGSIRVGYDAGPPSVEFNVNGFDGDAVGASCAMYSAKWLQPLLASPLDTNGDFSITGDHYRALVRAADGGNALVATVIDAYTAWVAANPYNGALNTTWHPRIASSVLYDAVATGLAFSTRAPSLRPGGPWFELENLPVEVTADGHTEVVGPERGGGAVHGDPQCAGMVEEATTWTERGRGQFTDWLVGLLCGDGGADTTHDSGAPP